MKLIVIQPLGRTYNSRGHSALLSNSQQAQGHQEALPAQHRVVGTQPLPTTPRMTTCTRSGTLNSSLLDRYVCDCIFVTTQNDRLLL